jgi:TatD DNase family protein
MMNLIDSHCHLQYFSNAIVAESLSAGLSQLICNATCESDWSQVLSLQSPYVIPCLGIHPWYVSSASPNWESALREFVQTPGVHIGEIGLDNYKSKLAPKPTQEHFFRTQLGIAKDYNKVANIHCVSAYGKMKEILCKVSPSGDLKVLLHSWEGPWEVAKPLLDHFQGNILFSLSMVSVSKPKHQSMISAEPILDYNDANKLINKPTYLKYVLQALSANLALEPELLAAAFSRNILRLFA